MLSFEVYNETVVLISAVEGYKYRTGHYPERVLADQIYRNRSNQSYCSGRGIWISGTALGRQEKNNKVDKKQEYIGNRDRFEVERAFSLAKRRFVMGLITTRLDVTTGSSIALSILAMNVNHFAVVLFNLFLISIIQGADQ